ncbi:MAG: GIY-YIG nuclease family protein, partial [Flavobacteriaceae bacterium]|nr:GIY-YIG nuclease family protein [Flavobacteriaceae bacterium]
IPFSDQHRAQGDAKVTVKLFELLLEKDLKKNILRTQVSSKHPNKVPLKYLDIVDKLPSEMGVYYISNHENEIIYIGKSNNIKKRLLNHLTSKSKKAELIQRQLHSVAYALTGGELVTLLKEQNEIKTNAPKLNKAMRYRVFPMGIRLDETDDYPNLIVEQVKKEHVYLSVYKNMKSAKAAVFNWIDNYGICIHKTSLSNSSGPCLQHALKKCDGACIGFESPEAYRKKVNALVATFHYPYTDFLIVSHGRKTGESSFVYIKDRVFCGYGYFELNHQIKDYKQITSRLVAMENNPDVEKLIRSFLSRKRYNKLIPLNYIKAS